MSTLAVNATEWDALGSEFRLIFFYGCNESAPVVFYVYLVVLFVFSRFFAYCSSFVENFTSLDFRDVAQFLLLFLSSRPQRLRCSSPRIVKLSFFLAARVSCFQLTCPSELLRGVRKRDPAGRPMSPPNSCEVQRTEQRFCAV